MARVKTKLLSVTCRDKSDRRVGVTISYDPGNKLCLKSDFSAFHFFHKEEGRTENMLTIRYLHLKSDIFCRSFLENNISSERTNMVSRVV